MRFLVVPETQHVESKRIVESENVKYECPDHSVMIGRMHEGDENGTTQYLAAGLRLFVDPFTSPELPVRITVENHIWHRVDSESNSNFLATDNRVITGRRHKGDENGSTFYRTSIVLVDGYETRTINKSELHPLVESSGQWFYASAYDVIVGRRHQGDENGKTWYTTANLAVEIPEEVRSKYFQLGRLDKRIAKSVNGKDAKAEAVSKE